MKKIKLIKLIIPALFIAMASFSGCEKEKIDTEPVTIPTTPFILEGCTWNLMNSDIVYIINNNEKFANCLACENAQQIDFDNKTLLLAFGVVPGGVSEVQTKLTKIGTTYTINVDVLLDFTDIAGDIWRIALLTNKLTTDDVELNVSYHH